MSLASQSVTSPANNWDEILSLARTYQYDRYIAATLAPRAARADLIVLAAFAGEMRRIPWTVSDSTIGMIRLQWWRDSLNSTPGQLSGNPLADSVNEMVARQQLPVGLLIGHIDAQEVELYSDLMDDMEQLRIHYLKREAGMFQLAARILRSERVSLSIDHAACAYGIARSVAEFAFRHDGRQLLIPRDLANSFGIQPGSELTPEVRQRTIPRLLGEMAGQANAEYEGCLKALGSIPRKELCILLPVTLTKKYAATAASPFDASNIANMGPSNFSKSCQMLLAYLRGQI